MKRSAWLMAGMIILSLLLFGCIARSGIGIDETASGTTVSLPAGQKLTVTLKSNPTTGYDWQVAEVDEAVLRPAKQEFQPASDPNRLGAPGQTVVEFEVVRAGTTNLLLIYVPALGARCRTTRHIPGPRERAVSLRFAPPAASREMNLWATSAISCVSCSSLT